VDDPYLAEYGSEAEIVTKLMTGDVSLPRTIDSELPYTFAQVIYAVRFEMARTVEDVLSRRTRALLLNAEAAGRAAAPVAALMATELGLDSLWAAAQVQQFRALVGSDYSNRPV
jgi:glycerol-3-phosphate dehydrogenase